TLARSLEKMTGQSFPAESEAAYVHGASEIELVRSGLEDMMHATYRELSHRWNDPANPAQDLRRAAYALAIDRIAGAYGYWTLGRIASLSARAPLVDDQRALVRLQALQPQIEQSGQLSLFLF
ncbi:MAG: hypothetical protein P8X51_18035, partial [Maritimibacter sp.]